MDALGVLSLVDVMVLCRYQVIEARLQKEAEEVKRLSWIKSFSLDQYGKNVDTKVIELEAMVATKDTMVEESVCCALMNIGDWSSQCISRLLPLSIVAELQYVLTLLLLPCAYPPLLQKHHEAISLLVAKLSPTLRLLRSPAIHHIRKSILHQILLPLLPPPPSTTMCNNGRILIHIRQLHGITLPAPRQIDRLGTISLLLVGKACDGEGFDVARFDCGVGMTYVYYEELGAGGGDEGG